jgi:DNA processing protein
MKKQWTLNEWLFAIGVYPALQANDKFSLCLEIASRFQADLSENEMGNSIFMCNRKGLSDKKKASFLTFAQQLDISKEMDKYRQQNIQWLHVFEVNYPPQLRAIYNPPVILFYRGNLSVLQNKYWLGVVGARTCTIEGLKTVDYILGDLLVNYREHIGIVSGLAKGIDTRAHQATIYYQGKTVGVIGSGIDRYYPYENRKLQEKMMAEQLVLTEYPLGAKPLKYHFPERNRIIAGLSRGILVIEAKKRSGSLITAYNAIDENRDVFAVPGSIFEPNNEGCNRLIQLGAVLTQNAEDILKEWHLII